MLHKGVMGPDEYHGSTDNNVYTNVVAGLAIYLAEYAQCVGGCPQVPPSWTQVVSSAHNQLFIGSNRWFQFSDAIQADIA